MLVTKVTQIQPTYPNLDLCESRVDSNIDFSPSSSGGVCGKESTSNTDLVRDVFYEYRIFFEMGLYCY